MEVRSAEAAELRIEVGKYATLQQWVVRKANAGNDMAGAKCDLLSLREMLGGIAVEDHFPNHSQRNNLLGDQLGRI